MDWDKAAPAIVIEKWQTYVNTLPALQDVQVKRWLGTTRNQSIELHGFCDASEQAMAAVIYCRAVSNDGSVNTSIIKAKTKVAPIGKGKLTVPRLELCAAVILAELMASVKSAFAERKTHSVLWSDSKIVLGWLQQSPNQQKTYISNRVAKIQRLTSDSNWLHVRTHENSADVASRGIIATELINHHLWWNGPSFLRQPGATWTSNELQLTTDEQATVDSEQKSAVVAVVVDKKHGSKARGQTWLRNRVHLHKINSKNARKFYVYVDVI